MYHPLESKGNQINYQEAQGWAIHTVKPEQYECLKMEEIKYGPFHFVI